MRVLIVAVGSRGDVAPCAGLGRALAAGHRTSARVLAARLAGEDGTGPVVAAASSPSNENPKPSGVLSG
jgi:UDP:flavonoid glycosyltransferase YjiC (YdhE family)